MPRAKDTPLKVILWGREGNTFYRQTDDGDIVIKFKSHDHVSITVQCGQKRQHRELRLRYGHVPHVGILNEANDMLERLAAQYES
jgi:hypothetical protein